MALQYYKHDLTIVKVKIERPVSSFPSGAGQAEFIFLKARLRCGIFLIQGMLSEGLLRRNKPAGESACRRSR